MRFLPSCSQPLVLGSLGWWLAAVPVLHAASQSLSRNARVITVDATNGFEQETLVLYEDLDNVDDDEFSISPQLHAELSRRLQQMNETDPNFYRDLRTVGTEIEESNYLFRVAVPNSTREFTLGELNAFLPFTLDGKTPGPGMQADAFAALLAVYHFNNVETSPILDPAVVRSLCPDLRFTMSLSDTQLYPIETTRLFIQQLKSTKSLLRPPATGILGAYRSSVSLPLAILSGVNRIPQISPAATANDFDDKEQFPLFGRTVWNAMDEARVALEFFSTIGSTHIVVLYITDTYGSSLQKAFQDAASKANITTAQVAMSYNIQDDAEELKEAIDQAEASLFRHVYAICFEQQLPGLMKEASSRGLVGDDYFWVFPAISPDNLLANPVDPLTARALAGAGIINGVGGITDTNEMMKVADPVELSSLATVAYNRFYEAWKKAHEDDAFVQFVLNSFPGSVKNVTGYNSSAVLGDMGSWSLFLYDAVTALVVAMCNASDSNQFFTGSEVFERFKFTEFFGSSGLNRFDHVTGTRDYQTVRWVVWNTRLNGTRSNRGDGSNASMLSFVPSFHWQDPVWALKAPFVYANGSTAPPSSLPPVNVQNNYIGTAGRAVGYMFMSITLLSSVLSVCWLFYYRDSYVVMSSQPLFLLMISVGTFIMAITILPLGFEELVIDNDAALSRACMSVPWLYISGASFPLSAVLAKVRGVHKAYVNPEIECIHVSDLDLVLSFASIFFVNFIVLICWTTISPLHWEREYGSSFDQFGRPSDTYARCISDNEVVFWSLLAVINLGVLVLCNWWAYRSRNIETEFNESSYVGVSAAAVLQAWAMGIPIIIVVVSDSPQAAFYVTTGIVFVTAQALVSLIYIPKVVALRKLRKEEFEKRKLESFRAHKNSGSRGGDDDEYEENGDHRGESLPDNRNGDVAALAATASTLPMSTEDTREINPQDPLSGASESVPPEDDEVGELSQSSNPLPFPSRVDFRASKSDPQVTSELATTGRGMPHTVSWSPGLEARQHSAPSVVASGEMAAGAGSADLTTASRDGSASFRQRPRRPTKSISMLSLRRLSVFSGGSGSSSSNSLVVPADAPASPPGARSTTGGPKILHNPRSQRSLLVSGGYELSRQQLEVLMQYEDSPSGLPSSELPPDAPLSVFPDGEAANGGGELHITHNSVPIMEALDEEDEGNDEGGVRDGDDPDLEGSNGHHHKSDEGV